MGQEADGNNGSAPRLKLKSVQEMSLVDIDATALLGRTIRSAMLHLKKIGDQSLMRVTVSSVGSEGHAMQGRSLVDGRTVQANVNRHWMMNSSYSTVFGLGASSTVRR